MNFKLTYTRNLLLSISLAVPTIAMAQPAILDANLNLNIPIIKFQADNQSEYFWAELEYQAQSSTPLTFIAKNYGSLDPATLPPALHELAIVTDGAAPTIINIQATEAQLHFISSIPLACSVIFGLDTAFGFIATDSAMNGGAIIDHNPILSNLQPESTYYYRVQGTDAQGKMYWSPINSFTTESANNELINLLSIDNGTTVTAVSSNFGNASNNQTWGANSAIDGSGSTAWSSANDGDDAFIELTLAQATQINTLKVWSRSMSNSAEILSFTITTDNETLGPFTLPDTQQAYEFEINRTSSSLRFDVITSTGGNTGLIELQAY